MVVAACQRLLRTTFDADRFNLIAAMMKDNFVHFHLVPRYAQARELDGVTWQDPDWPSLIGFSRETPSATARDAVLQRLRADFAAAELPE
jgi:diadenosine tetraphosphate (Ap4A) HIT family hydrolase